MNKGTIVYIGGFKFPDKNAAAKATLSYAKILRKLNYRVVFLGIDEELPNSYDISATKKNIHGFDVWSIPYPHGNKQWLKYLMNIDDFLYVASQYNDIRAVICYNYQSIALFKIIDYCRKKGIKVISNCTEWFGNSGENFIFNTIKFIDTSLRMKIANRYVDGLIVTSNYLKEYYNKCNIVIIPTLSELADNHTEDCNKDSSVEIAYAGIPFRLGIRLKNRSDAKDRLDKSLSYLYEVFKQGVKFRFNIYGLTYEQYITALPDDKKILDEMKNCVFFHGYINGTDIYNKIQKSDFTILIRDKNRVTMAGFPTKFTESINCGTPVITTKTSDLQDYLVEGKNGFFLELNKEDDIVNKLIHILSMSQEEIQKMKKYCLESKLFDIENWTEIMDDFLKNTIE